MEKNTPIRIYVACLAAYNNGHLHGRWIDAKQDAWAIYDDIRGMLSTSPIVDAEEWAIHDHEGFRGLSISESESIDHVAQLAAFIAEHGEFGAELVHQTGDIEQAAKALEESYLGSFESLADYVEELTEETMHIPNQLRLYIDWNAMAHDAELNGDVFTVKTAYNEVHVFAGM